MANDNTQKFSKQFQYTGEGPLDTKQKPVADIASLPIYPEKLSFDEVVKTMYQTGRDLKVAYRETAKGGLAKSDLRED